MNRQWLYAKQPQGKIAADTFQWHEAAMPVVQPGEALVKTRMLSLDPANRAWMMGKTYRDALEPGQVMAVRALRGDRPVEVAIAVAQLPSSRCG